VTAPTFRQGPLAFAAVLAFTGCSAAVENPPAYSSERNLCAAKHASAWDAKIARCRAAYDRDKSCGGLMSFAGRLEGEQITVSSELGATEFADRIDADGSTVRVEVKLYGRSPYFAFDFEWRGLGGAVTDEDTERELRFESALESTDDDIVRGALRLSVAGESRAFAPRAGTLKVTRQAAEEQVATFDVAIGGSGDHLSGCFDAFVVRRTFDRKGAMDAGL
jgi:hypothetical protein